MAEDEVQRRKREDSAINQTPPSAAYVRWLLAQGDTTDPASPLHRLGIRPSDAAPGNHTHNGRNSSFLFRPGVDVVTGDISVTAGQRTAIKGILNQLAKLGLTDNTTN